MGCKMSNIREVAQRICANIRKFKTLSGRDVNYVEKEIRDLLSEKTAHLNDCRFCNIRCDDEQCIRVSNTSKE